MRSVPAADAVGELVGRSYDLEVIGCVLVRSLVNDVYEVMTPDRRYALKVYAFDHWSTEEVAWEVALVDHLATAGIEVARVARLNGGVPVGALAAPEGSRPFTLSEWVEGSKPEPPFDHALYRDFGHMVARLHHAADGFKTERYRRPFGLRAALDQPLAQVLPALADRPQAQELVRELAVAARRRLTELAADEMDWGVRHGDVTLDNLHRTPAGLAIHDFDLAHEGWRAADLTGCLATPFADSFLAGYEQVRRLRPADLAAVPWLGVVERIGHLAFHLVDKPALRGIETVSEGWVDDNLNALRASAERLL